MDDLKLALNTPLNDHIDPVEKEITHLLVLLANSLHDQFPDCNIRFSDLDQKIVKNWLIKLFIDE